MKPYRVEGAFFLALVVLAAILRFTDLAARPMHADEAIHADKLGGLLEGSGYAYDPAEYHGPTLYYLTLVPAWLAGARRYVDVDEVVLRSVPAALGTALVAAHVLARPWLGPLGAALAALFAALSPAMVYYSRYYIHEVPLVAFSFGLLLALARWLQRPSRGALLVAGGFAGLMLATKETAPIAIASMLAAAAAARAAPAGGEPPAAARARLFGRDSLVGLAAAAGVAALVAALFFSSFLTRPAGLVDALRAAGPYLERATASSWHVHPWHFYLNLLLNRPGPDTPVWSDGVLLLLGALGGGIALAGRTAAGADGRVLRFVALYTLLMLGVYSAIPYKTPWCLLGFLHGAILLAGAGAAWLVGSARGVARVLAIGLVAGLAVLLGRQAVAASFRFAADPRNPYVYAHTGTDVFEIVSRIEALAAAHPKGRAMPVQIASRENLWPLPFYLRRFTRVEWWTGISDDAPAAPVIVVTPDMEEALVRRLYDVPAPGERELYVPIFEHAVELRPGLELRGFAAASLWDDFRRSEGTPLPTRATAEPVAP